MASHSARGAVAAPEAAASQAQGKTLPSRHQQAEPRLPHERDESSDSHPGTQDERIQQAARDLASGQQDTGLSPVLNDLARREFPGGQAADRVARDKPRR